MGDPAPYPDRGDDSIDRGSAKNTPRWVTVVGIMLAIALVAIFVVLHLTGALGPAAH